METDNKRSPAPSEELQPVVEILDPTTLNPPRSSRGRGSRLPWFLVCLLAVALGASAAFNFRQYSVEASLQAQIEDLETQLHEKGHDYTEAQADYTTAKNQIECIHAVLNDKVDALERIAVQAVVFDSTVRLVVSDETQLYHRYGCPFLKSQERALFWNTEYAESLGFHPCPICCSEDSELLKEREADFLSARDLFDLIHSGDDQMWFIVGTMLKSASKAAG